MNFVQSNISYIHQAYQNNLVTNSFWISNEVYIENCYVIMNNNNIPIGLLQLQLGEFDNHRKFATVDMIELFNQYRFCGIGKQVINELFKIFHISTLFGEALSSAIPFWYGLGANFEMSNNKLLEYVERGYSACFKLTKKKLKI